MNQCKSVLEQVSEKKRTSGVLTKVVLQFLPVLGGYRVENVGSTLVKVGSVIGAH